MLKPIKIVRNLVVGIIATVIIASNVHAQAGGVITASTAIDSLISNLSEEIQTIISEIEATSKITSFSIRSDLLVLLDNLSHISEALVGKTFGEINKSQQKFFQETKALVDKSRSGAELILEDVESVLDGASETISRIPGFETRPFVKKYSPSYALQHKESHTIKIRGTLIGNDEPTLKFGDIACNRKSKTDRLLEYQCKGIFQGDSDWVTGALTVFDQKPWYQIWGNPDSFNYQVSVRSINTKIGSYKLVDHTINTIEARNPREASNAHQNGHCQGTRRMVWSYSPQSGCYVDVNSVNVVPHLSSKSSYGGVHSLTNTGFQVIGNVQNNGSCGPKLPFSNSRAYYDGRGRVQVNVSWVDVCPTSAEVASESINGDVYWGQDKSFQLSQSSTKFLLTIYQNNGEEHVFNESSDSKFYEIIYDIVGKTVLVKPKELEEAFK